MNYILAIANALEAAKLKTDHYGKIPDPKYLIEAADWLQVAVIYIEQMKV